MSDENAVTPTRATVAILTYNGEAYLERILTEVLGQELDGAFEVLVIDSGSTDSTLDIVRRFSSVRLHEIPNSEFGHGKTRNLAAQLATGEFVAYLTHDAIPASRQWLRELLEPFRLDKRIVAVMGKQIPRSGCFPLLKYEIQGVFAGFGPDWGTSVFYKDAFVQSEGVLNAISFYSDVNSAARRDFLLNTIPYRDVRYAEDQLFGKDLIEAGYRKAYAGRAAVEHSNDLTLAEYGKRIFDETIGLRQIGFPIPPMTGRAQLRLTMRGIAGDTLRILRDPDFSWKRRFFWLAMNPPYQVRKWTSYRASTLTDLTDQAALDSGSLETARKI
ncbi:glycosyltransferase family 2 protein [Cryobacterium sinapicolor]|uniref:Glycosyltransferase family 2 protein n=1 Tax=Cryobacterium sinapicolor TaxID=1259236 RepID=A0ABY2JAR1_9MICO|nr:glycosyltransferase family 2 protein [Cryobacterium sinapicolor]TFD00921.1 glycosyltransferase family 2 protein [Cryobacterium sinapicolor]